MHPIGTVQIIDGWISLLLQPKCSPRFSDDPSSDRYTDCALSRRDRDGMIRAHHYAVRKRNGTDLYRPK
jgi:hypothetical protein